MDEGAVAGVGNKPFAAKLFGKINGLFRAIPDAYAAAFAGDVIHGEDGAPIRGAGCRRDGREAAQLVASAAACAGVGANDGQIAAVKLFFLPHGRL